MPQTALPGCRTTRTRKTILYSVDFYLKKAKDAGNTPDTLNKQARIFKGLVTENPCMTNTLAEKIEATKKAKGEFSPSLLAWAEERGFKYLRRGATADGRVAVDLVGRRHHAR